MVALTLAVNFVRSGVGRGLAALAADEVAAAAMGVDVRRGKIAVFTISAIFASVGGSLFAHYLGTITPDTFGIFASIDFVIMVVVGGLGSLWGSLVGAAFVTGAAPCAGPPRRVQGHLPRPARGGRAPGPSPGAPDRSGRPGESAVGPSLVRRDQPVGLMERA